MSKKLYVGNLPFSVNSEKLKELFASYGHIEEAQVISFKDTGKSKGFGFVTIQSDVEADKAIQEMNDKEIEGRKIKVNEATPFDPNKPRERRSFKNSGFRKFSGRSFNRNKRFNGNEESRENSGDSEDF